MLLGIDFPPDSAEWVFFVSFAVILLGPLLFERLGRRDELERWLRGSPLVEIELEP